MLRRLTCPGFFKQAKAERDHSRQKLSAGARRDSHGKLLFYVSE